MDREKLRLLATETDRIVADGRYRSAAGAIVPIRDQVDAAVRETVQYPADLPISAPAGFAGEIEVTGESTLAAAVRLLAAAPDPVAALNFASAKHPGGGYRSGARAQEESIARSSALAVALESQPTFYAHHTRQRGDSRYTDRIIYSPAVPVFRGDDGTLLEQPYPLSLITSPAPNVAAMRDPAHLAQVPQILRTRVARILTVAARHGHRRLVLGAWGCGVFGNDPSTVAGAFAGQLTGSFATSFDLVVFAILDVNPGAPTRETFRQILLDGQDSTG